MKEKGTMRNLLLYFRFKGTNYYGYQIQKNHPSITNAIQNTIEKVTGIRSDIIGCSRTDAGVHANMYCLNFRTNTVIPDEKIAYVITNQLPEDIVCYKCVKVHDNFHARYYSKGKEYVYIIQDNISKNPILKDLVYHFPFSLNLDLMKKGAEKFIGTHDFKAFSNQKISGATTTTKTIKNCNVIRKDGLIYATVEGDSFLTHMVRIIVGTLVEVGHGKINGNDIGKIIQSKNRKKAGRTAPSHGLYLNKVLYNEDFSL